MGTRTKQPKRLEDYEPGATRKQVLEALSKAARAPRRARGGKTSAAEREAEETEAVKIAADIVIRQNLEAFKELERY